MSALQDPVLWIPGAAIVLAAIVVFRWLARLQAKVDNHAERISWLEAKTNGKHREDT